MATHISVATDGTVNITVGDEAQPQAATTTEAKPRKSGGSKSRSTKSTKRSKSAKSGRQSRTQARRAKARELYGKPYNELTEAQQGKVVEALKGGKATKRASKPKGPKAQGFDSSKPKGSKANPYKTKGLAASAVKRTGKPSYYVADGKAVQVLPPSASKKAGKGSRKKAA